MLLSPQDLPQHKQHELLYYIAVAKFKLGKHIEARNQLRELLKVPAACGHTHQPQLRCLRVQDCLQRSFLLSASFSQSKCDGLACVGGP